MKATASLFSLVVMLLVLFMPIHSVTTPVEEPTLSSAIYQGEAAALLPIVNNFLKNLRTGKIDNAYTDFTTKAFREETSLEEFKKFVSDAKDIGHNKLFKFLSFYTNKGIAIFEGALVSTQGVSIHVEFDLKQEGSDWKIDGIQLFNSETVTPPQNYLYEPHELSSRL